MYSGRPARVAPSVERDLQPQHIGPLPTNLLFLTLTTTTHLAAMASRPALSRLAAPLRSSSKIIRPSAASLSTSAAAARLTSQAALATTPLARVQRDAPRFLVDGGRRNASSEGTQMMVSSAVACVDLSGSHVGLGLARISKGGVFLAASLRGRRGDC
jgi:hypothetical protein